MVVMCVYISLYIKHSVWFYKRMSQAVNICPPPVLSELEADKMIQTAYQPPSHSHQTIQALQQRVEELLAREQISIQITQLIMSGLSYYKVTSANNVSRLQRALESDMSVEDMFHYSCALIKSLDEAGQHYMTEIMPELYRLRKCMK